MGCKCSLPSFILYVKIFFARNDPKQATVDGYQKIIISK